MFRNAPKLSVFGFILKGKLGIFFRSFGLVFSPLPANKTKDFPGPLQFRGKRVRPPPHSMLGGRTPPPLQASHTSVGVTTCPGMYPPQSGSGGMEQPQGLECSVVVGGGKPQTNLISTSELSISPNDGREVPIYKSGASLDDHLVNVHQCEAHTPAVCLKQRPAHKVYQISG